VLQDRLHWARVRLNQLKGGNVEKVEEDHGGEHVVAEVDLQH